MNESRCPNPLSADVLGDYWLAELSPVEEEAVEEHLLGCDECGSQLRELIALGEAIREVARRGGFG